jgi:WD40 repeat protein
MIFRILFDKLRRQSPKPQIAAPPAPANVFRPKPEDAEFPLCLDGNGGPTWSVAILPDGRRAISASIHALHLWDIESGKIIRKFVGHRSAVLSVSVFSNGRFALSGSADGTVRLWDIEKGTELRSFEGHSNYVFCALAIEEKGQIISGSLDRTIRLWDISTGAELRLFQGHTDAVTCIRMLPDGFRFISSSWDGELRLDGFSLIN